MIINKRYLSLIEAILCSFALMVFSYFIHYGFPFRLISVAALIVPAYFFSKNLQSLSDLKNVTGKFASFKITVLFCTAGLLLGILLAIIYRRDLEISLFPDSIHLFVIVAALIGCIEELVFRGLIQDYVKSINAPFSILFSTISHTGYKCCLFLSPIISSDIDIGFLALWTFVAGIIFGTIKHFSKSIMPSLIAHALFDILVYAEYVYAPWWVW
jgi:membrane protease YdiL (CAAX protease family)